MAHPTVDPRKPTTPRGSYKCAWSEVALSVPLTDRAGYGPGVGFKVATWNLWWAHATQARGARIREVIEGLDAEILVLTEAELDMVPSGGHVVDAGADWGYRVARPGRRKVIMWSRVPWSDVDPIGSVKLPGGRWVAATTDTPAGPVRVVGVCIPWKDAHVLTGRRDRARWEDHLEFLSKSRTLVSEQPRPLIVAGDFNQAIPRSRQPRAAADELERWLGDLTVATASGTEHGRLIDHVAVSAALVANERRVLPALIDGARLSDHTGALVAVERPR